MKVKEIAVFPCGVASKNHCDSLIKIIKAVEKNESIDQAIKAVFDVVSQFERIKMSIQCQNKIISLTVINTHITKYEINIS